MPRVLQNLIREAPICDPHHVVTDADLKKLEAHIDAVWKKLNADVKFTSHFIDRVNDARNGRQITLCELARIFLEAFRQYGKKLANIPKERWEAVLSDKTTDVNVPFVLKHNGKELEIIAKTVMRKHNFMTPDTKLMVAHRTYGEDMKALKEWTGFGDPQVAPVAGPFAVDDVNTSAYRVEDPEVLTMLNGFLSSLTQRTFLNPYYPLQQAFTKLQSVGLSFPLRGVNLGGDTGTVFLPVSQFGGRLGMDLDGTWIDDDGISNRVPGGLSLKVDYSSHNGEYSVGMQLATAADGAGLMFGEEITEEPVPASTGSKAKTTPKKPGKKMDNTRMPWPKDYFGVKHGQKSSISGFSEFVSTEDANPTPYPYSPEHGPDQDNETLFDDVREAAKSSAEWTAHYKGKPKSTIQAAYRRTEDAIHNHDGVDVKRKQELMAKLAGLRAALNQ